MRKLLFTLCLLPSISLAASVEAIQSSIEQPTAQTSAKTQCVTINTSLGNIDVQLNAEKAPLTVANFLQYVDSGFYSNTLFHRVIPNFMVQGGGFDTNGQQKRTNAPIKNEAANGLTNKRGSIAMARTSSPHSATAQFFINTVNNGFLNKAQAQDGWGYTVFGEVTNGMSTVDAIGKVKTHVGSLNGYGTPDVPVKQVLIQSISRSECGE